MNRFWLLVAWVILFAAVSPIVGGWSLLIGLPFLVAGFTGWGRR